MKRGVLLAAALFGCLLLTACGKKEITEPASVQTEPASQSSELQELSSALEQVGDIDVEKGLFNVTITFPASFMEEDMTQEKLDESIKDDDQIKSAVLNSDGSATYVMTKKKHQEMIDDTKNTIDEALKELIDDESMSITDIEANADYTKFTVTISTQEVGIYESVSVLTLYTYGGMYGIITGKEVDNIHVDFVNESTGKIIESADSKNMEDES